jgi:hypothetical protein
MPPVSSNTTYELPQGILGIQCTETPVDVNDPQSQIQLMIQFTRHSDGKLFESRFDDQDIHDLHQIFFDTSLILDILDRVPKSLEFCKNIDLDPETARAPGGIDSLTDSECLDLRWDFEQTMTKQRSKVYPVTLRVPEKRYPVGSNQQIIEMSRLLTCYKQRLSDLESRSTQYNIDLEGNRFIPTENSSSINLTFDDMQWCAFSDYGSFTGLDKYFAQFKNCGDMQIQLYSRNSQNDAYDNSTKHINDWLVQNDLKFDDVLSAQYRLNRWIANSECELINIGLPKNTNLISVNIMDGKMT